MTAMPGGPAGFAVLVVDDDPVLRDLVADLLREQGYRVATAADGAEAVRVARLSRPDLVLMDYEMPALDGLAATREIRSLPGRPVPVVMISSRDDAATRAAARAAGIERYLVKPVSLDALQAIVAGHVAAQPGRDG